MTEGKIVEFKGTVEKCIYNTDNYKVYALSIDRDKYPDIKLNSYNNVSINGDMQELDINGEYEVIATEESSKYGIGYKVTKVTQDIPMSGDGLLRFLMSTIPENRARVLFEHYPDIIDIVKQNKTNNIDTSKMYGYGEKTLTKDIAKISSKIEMADIIAMFGDVLTDSQCQKLYYKYGSADSVKEKLNRNPYATLINLDRIGFKLADSLVLKMNNEGIIEPNKDILCSPDRCYAAVIHLLQENEDNGNTVANLVGIRKQCFELVGDAAHHFIEVIKADDIYYDKDTLDIALKRTYKCEKYIANSIKYGLSVNRRWDFDWKQYQNKGEFNLSDEQIELLHSVCKNNIVILTGGAGMGKSASTKMLINMLEDNNKTFILSAPTGKSAKVLKDFSGVDAKTVHRTLNYNPKTGWGHNKNCKLDCDVLVVDELSMVSVELMSHVIDAIDFNRTKLVMIGDPNQLPSVSAGNLLYDFLASKTIPVVRLTKVFRYGTGGILTAATNIIGGSRWMMNDNDKVLTLGNDGGYTFIKSEDETIVANVVSLYKKLITVGTDGRVYKPEEIAVLTAYNKGDYGTVMLNSYLQKIANENYGSNCCLKYGNSVYYMDDIVMQCSNNYKMQVYEEEEEAFVANGECSKITLVDRDFMVGNFDDVRIKYYKDNLSELSLAYSYSIHRSQGSTIKVVIVMSPRSHIYMTTMNLLYVAITRASDKCFHFGLPSTINMALKKKENFNRNTFMKNFLKEGG